ncbi:DegT/DnrJ/EryC1/StrS family aminotransferase [Prochlorococcus sp. MIT 0916]|uniref:DegT/DnrJ/EryC1/StrS family aminotransferase n=1 Tax=Prochlorococcus sp. MIT 0916 TaxID=3082521 RepID=UPI0039B3CB66
MKKNFHFGYPSLCELDEFSNLLKDSWDSNIITNNGPLLQKLEKKICEVLNINNYCAVANGTIALQLAIEALEIKGTILIPAFSWIASANAVKWQKCKVKYCDIDPKTLNICPNSIKKNIDASTEAIMPVHIFGNPCDIKSILSISKRYNLKVIYDAAHSFGTTFNGKSVFLYGDISCVSTHATKIFNTAEGGGLICNNENLKEKIKLLRYFGFDDDKNVILNGINAKMSEIHAALGLANIKYFSKTLIHRKKIYSIYRNELNNCNNIAFQEINKGSNCSYSPIIFEDEKICLKIQKVLMKNNVFAKRYFYPSLNNIKNLVANEACPNSESISKRILCLPSSNNINNEDALFISRIIKNA